MLSTIRKVALTASVLVTSAHFAIAADPWQPSPEDRAGMIADADRIWQRRFADKAGLDWNKLATLVLENLALGRSEEANRAIEAIVALQDTDPRSPTYGNIRWRQNDTSIVDFNGVEFASQYLLVAYRLYRDQLDDAHRDLLFRFLQLARTGVERHTVALEYTNIYLMKAANLIGLGEVLNEPKLAEAGRKMLRDWLARVRKSGVTEYLSPIYTGVDIENLSIIVNLSTDAEAQQLARAGLDILWSDVALHWYGPGERLGGPHSRDYERLTNRGFLTEMAARSGWIDDAPRSPLNPYKASAFVPPSSSVTASLTAPLPRFVMQRVGEAPEERIAAYVGKQLYIGSASSGYNTHDNLLVANLGAGADIPTISAFMDGRGDHFGRKPYVEKASGHSKLQHLMPFVASAQNGPEALFLASALGSGPEGTSMETTVILPADAEYQLDSIPLNIFRSYSQWKIDPRPVAGATAVTVKANAEARTEVLVNDQSDTAGVGLSQRFPVKEGDRIKFTAEISGGPIALYLNFEDALGRLVGKENIKPAGANTAFNQVEIQARAPVGSAKVRAWLYSTTGNKTDLSVRNLAVERLPKDERGETERLASFDFAPVKHEDITIPTGLTLTVRRGNAAIALRPLGAWAPDGKPVDFHLVNDGLEYGALRLTALHSETTTEGRGTSALWIGGEENLSTDAARLAFEARAKAVETTAKMTGDIIDLRAHGFGPAPLRVQVNVASGKRLSIEGMPDINPVSPVSVNSVPLIR